METGETGEAGASFAEYGISPELLAALKALHYEQPTEIQQRVMKPLLEGRDLLVKSKTGSGKTAAFGIPICERVQWEENAPQALVLEPTRELAFQVRDELFAIGRLKRLKVPVLYGGIPMEHQERTLRQKNHIVVGTPGRVLDHLMRGTFPPVGVRYVVIDEADLMLDMGFLEDVKEILSYFQDSVQLLLFSATVQDSLWSFSRERMRNPLEILLESDTQTVDSIEQRGYFVEKEEKPALLQRILMAENPKNCMIFCATREMVEVLYYRLKKEGVRLGMLHGLIDQKLRTRTIEDFRTGAFHYLIATDVAARGVDFEEITHVIHYDFPTSKETYVHRTGRTGRNGAAGIAISLILPEEEHFLRTVERYTQATLTLLPPVTEEEAEQGRKAFERYACRVPTVRKRKKQDVFDGQIQRLTIGGGRKSKIRAGDLVGAISSIEGIDGTKDIGMIDIRDSISLVEILNGKGALVLEQLPQKTVKGKYRKVQKTWKR